MTGWGLRSTTCARCPAATCHRTGRLPAPGKSALAIVVDVSGKLPQAKELLEKTTKTQLQRGAKRSEVKVAGCPDPIIQFDLPELEEEKEAARSTLEGQREQRQVGRERPPPEKPPERKAFYCLTGNLLVVTDDLGVMKGILDRVLRQSSERFAGQPQAVPSRHRSLQEGLRQRDAANALVHSSPGLCRGRPRRHARRTNSARERASSK